MGYFVNRPKSAYFPSFSNVLFAPSGRANALRTRRDQYRIPTVSHLKIKLF